MRIFLRVAGVGAVALLAGAVAASFSTAASRDASPLQITPIEAVFAPKLLATNYSVNATHTEPGKKLTYTWTLKLALVDAAGAAPKGYQNTDPNLPLYAAAAADPTCDNSKLAGGNGGVWKNQSNEFTWYHGDKGAYPDAPAYGCDHTKMGPSGHQGVVSVVVSDGSWQCTASIKGSNLTETPVYGAAPDCSEAKGAGNSAKLIAGLATIDKDLEATIASVKAGTLLGKALDEAIFKISIAFSAVLRDQLGQFDTTQAPAFRVILDLSNADRNLDLAEDDVSGKGTRRNAHGNLTNVSSGLHDTGAAFSSSPGTSELAGEFKNLSQEANNLGVAARDKTMTDADLAAAIRKLRAAKEALIAKLPKVHGVPGGTVFNSYGTINELFLHAEVGAAGRAKTLASLNAIVAAKTKLETDFRRAAGG